MPRALIELQPLFTSILGAPASGKSYFLAAMTWQLRQSLGTYFSIAFGDAEPAANRGLNEYEELLFLNSRQDDLVAIRKTELQRDLYDTVLFDQQTVSYPRPFIFSLKPLPNHPGYATMARLSRAFCLYDNAGSLQLPTVHCPLPTIHFVFVRPRARPAVPQGMRGKDARSTNGLALITGRDAARSGARSSFLAEFAPLGRHQRLRNRIGAPFASAI